MVLDWHYAEGEWMRAGSGVCSISGPARAVLTAERCALNFLQLLSGVATATRQFVDIVRGTPASILDTRKTLPGLRLAQKYAVRVGVGGTSEWPVRWHPDQTHRGGRVWLPRAAYELRASWVSR
jgi:nicotinate-nucleotide pyrophosphorylase